MKKNSLAYRLIITFTLILATALIVVAGVLSVWFKQYYFNEKKEQLNKESTIIESAAITYLTLDKSSNLTTLKNVMDFVGKTVDADILVADNMGYTYAVSKSEHEDYKFTNLGIPKEDMEILKEGKSIEYGNVKTGDKSDYVYLKPIFNKEYFSGVIVMIIPAESIVAPIIRVNEVIWITAIIAIIVGGIVVYIYSKKSLIEPIDKVTTVAKRLAKGEVNQRLEIKSNNEIGELAESFNIMAESLQQVDENRRIFISNVSHELRSPMTSIKGFITAILDGVIPKDKEEYYLVIVNDEISRLTRLINDLLDLSAMQAGKLEFNISELELNRIIETTVLKMNQKAASKNIKIEVLLESEKLYVYGDNDRLIQVVTNLVDNAIKYCDENGEVKISTKTKGSKIIVSIFNTSKGIDEYDLTHIWDRFYKVDKARSNKTSTGLGLSIVRNIILQLEEDIWAENVKDKNGEIKGVRFNFTLTKVK